MKHESEDITTDFREIERIIKNTINNLYQQIR